MTAFAFPITVGHTTSPTVNVFEPTVGAFGKMGSAPPEHAATGGHEESWATSPKLETLHR